LHTPTAAYNPPVSAAAVAPDARSAIITTIALIPGTDFIFEPARFSWCMVGLLAQQILDRLDAVHAEAA
jgi:hypothetical protein